MIVNLMYHNIVQDHELVVSDYDISLEDLELDIKYVQNSGNKYVNFTFDDGRDGSILGAELLSQYKMKGIFFIISERIGSRGHLDKDEIRKIHQMGHTIGSHSHTHSMFNKLSDNDVIFELQKSKDILEDIILSEVDCFAFPGGRRKRHHSDLAKELGYKDVFNSFESFASKYSAEIPRFHVRQSTRGCLAKIIRKRTDYILIRYVRSILSEIKSFID